MSFIKPQKHSSTGLWPAAHPRGGSPLKFQGSLHRPQASMHGGSEAVSRIFSSPVGSHNGERRRNS